MKLVEVSIVTHVNYNFTKFYQNRISNKKVLLVARFSAQNFKVSVELWKSYIVLKGHTSAVSTLYNLCAALHFFPDRLNQVKRALMNSYYQNGAASKTNHYYFKIILFYFYTMYKKTSNKYKNNKSIKAKAKILQIRNRIDNYQYFAIY